MGVSDSQESGMSTRFPWFSKHTLDFPPFVVKISHTQEVKLNVLENDINSKTTKQWRENTMYSNIKLSLY